MRLKDISVTIDPLYPIRPSAKYEGVRPINIYLLRLLYLLMFFVLGQLTWTHILTHRGPWDPTNAVAWCVWTAFATLAGHFYLSGTSCRALPPLTLLFQVIRNRLLHVDAPRLFSTR